MEKGPAISIYGTIPAGLPIDAVVEPDGKIALDETLFGLKAGSKVFALRVRGNSMTGAGINDGDLVFLIDRVARHRDIVAALIDGESTLKRFMDQPDGAVLHAENSDYEDLHPVSEMTIQGVMVGLFRRGAG
jgi:repressor LexA